MFFNLMQIEMPVGALTSIAHRITGILLALGVPAAVYLFDLSLRDAQAFGHLVEMGRSWPFKIAIIGFVWALAHHLLAGVRHLLSDIDIGSRLPHARRSAWIVNASGAAIALLAAGALL
ncbi:MAG: succinate dehydrogenase, cytochrome b556 subunit [Caldimonas sp.]